MDEPARRCVACGVLLSDPQPRWCPACGTAIERRSADRPPASVWRRRRIGLIAGAVVVAMVIAGTVALLSNQRATDDTDLGGPADLVDRAVLEEPALTSTITPAVEPVDVR